MGTRSDNLPNGLYRDDDGSIGLIICPKCQRENYALIVLGAATTRIKIITYIKIKTMKVKDIIKDDKFNEFLGYEIEAYNNRPAPQEGCRYRRTPYDALKDAGIFTVEGIRETFIKVANLESGLPKSQRDAITGLVFRVAQTVVNYRAKQEVEAKK